MMCHVTELIWITVICLVPFFSVTHEQDSTTPASETIVNGEDADISEFPFVCHLLYMRQPRCTCVLTGPMVVLTAAHCVQGVFPPLLTVIVGLQDRRKVFFEVLIMGAKSRPVIFAKAHPFYSASSLVNDIAIIWMMIPVWETRRIRPVDRIAGDGETFIGNSQCYICGYGALNAEVVGDDVRTTPATVLQKARLPIITNSDCSDQIGGVRESNVCVFDVKYGKSGCYGDSGGPLVCKVDTEWVLVGVASYGFKSCSAPTVYTRVSSYNKWLRILKVL